MVEAKIVPPHSNSAYRIHWNDVVTDSGKASILETTRLNFPYFEKMANLKAAGSVNTLKFELAKNITINEWMGIEP